MGAATAVSLPVIEPALTAPESPVRVYRRALLNDKLTLLACIYLTLLVFAAVFAPWVAPFDPEDQSLFMRNLPPLTMPEDGGTIPHVLGTDQLGRDELSRLIFGGRVSLAVGIWK